MHREEGTPLFIAIGAALLFASTAAAADSAPGNQRLWVAQGPNLSYGYIDQAGKFIIEPQWAGATAFEGDRASVAQYVGNSFFQVWALIDRTGKPVTPFQFEDALEFHDGLAKARLRGKSGDPYGFVDKNGNFVIKPRFGGAWKFVNGLAPVYTVGKNGAPNESGFIDTTGKLVIKLGERHMAKPFSDGVALVNDFDGGQYYIDARGTRVVNVPKSLGESFGFSQGLAVTRLDKKYGYIDRKGQYFIKPIYDDARDFKNGMAAVKIGDKWGYIDGMGKLVVGATFEAAHDYSEGHAAVKLDGLWYYLNNNAIRTPSVEGWFENPQPFKDGLASATRWLGEYRFQTVVFAPGYKHNRNPKNVTIPAEVIAAAKADEWGERVGPVAVSDKNTTDAQKAELAKVGIMAPLRPVEAKAIVDELAKQRVVEAWIYRARMFETGQGEAKDDKEAFKWYATAASSEHPVALHRIALMWQSGRGPEGKKQPVMAGDALWSAARKGHAPAMRQLAAIYMDGFLADVDLAKADQLLFEAAKLNDGQSIYVLSHFHRLGFNGRKPEQADDLVKLAMRHGSRDAYYDQALKLYESGEKDKAKSIMSITAAGGHPKAKAKLKEWSEAK